MDTKPYSRYGYNRGSTTLTLAMGGSSSELGSATCVGAQSNKKGCPTSETLQ